ncbi:bifunctional acetate--CoA ligase family protein/GNAT family N-acetyltransferase [Aeoliella mucimassa]|uniref:Succinyl-CoA ligase [ADP-forming] subunit alpha n=1 Tax=Aeoliella mucimassa TaxID=2527972 RepID=A0A518APV8_9BACT|nr:bifunctional acetate--CoA ligase family protein/GNAT family N-acetyltransferase [Aeoliella mucimassa]QDU56757.1 Succinyl-CoA ligase [ADP-forming] subunit alpha [Aeoliella mucimassa]
MPVRNIDKIFNPKSVAVIGASHKPDSIGHTVVKNMVDVGFEGELYPINPKHESICDRQCYKNVGSLPTTPDLAVICTPAATVPGLVHECGQAGIRGLLILSAGFREMGEEGRKLEDQLRQAASEYDGMRIVGPNCLGIMSPHVKLNASFANATPAPGRVALISQSGALCTAILDWARQEHVGFSHFVSLGNTLDVTIGDLIDYFATDSWTESLILYVESITEAREFLSAARAFSRNKPIIAYKAGRFAESAEAAASHTGAMAGVDTVYEAAFNRAGIVRITEMSDMFDCAELLARQEPPKGPRLAILTNAGGPGVMATDALLDRDGVLAKLKPESIEKLNEFLPAAWSHGNPVDVLGDASPERLGKALDIVVADEGVDAVLVVFAPQAMSKPLQAAEAVIEVAKKTKKPVLTSWMGGVSMAEAIDRFNRSGIPTYAAPEPAVRAFMYLVSYARTKEVLYETPREVPVGFRLDRGKLRGVFDTILSEGNDTLTESTSKALLESYEIPVAKPYVARTAEDAVSLAERLGYPVVQKILSPEITHKTDVGGVELSLATAEEVTASFNRIVGKAAELRPDAHIEGVTVQKMITSPVGRELIVGARRDAVFGMVLLVGAGGTSAELFKDRALELPPLNERLARRSLEALKSWPLLTGYRGRPPVNIDRLIEVLIRLSYLVADYPEIKEFDVNPLLVTPDDVIALDARVILDHDMIVNPPKRFSHLAIRPYPEEFTRRVEMKDGRQVLLRPIKPEDEPMWHDMLASCSKESIWFRFRYLFKKSTHDMATRFCFIDYDREIAIAAEMEENGQRKLVGVSRLVPDADCINADYGVLVADPYQGQGLGSILTDYCLEICTNWGIRTIVAETAPQNQRMISIFTNRGFKLKSSPGDDVVLGVKEMVEEMASSKA